MEKLVVKTISNKFTATPVLLNGGWDVEIKIGCENKQLLCAGRAPYTKAQAQVAADSARRDYKNHGTVDCS